MILNRDLGKYTIPANRFFALVNLRRQSIDDALEYISFALDQAEKNEQGEELFLACYYAASVNFLYGNLSKAERLALRAEEAAAAFGHAEWGMRARFFRGRICFDTGRYKEALDVFESIMAVSSGRAFLRLPAMIQTVSAWIYRTKNFLNNFSSVTYEGLSSLDGKIFEAEAAYFSRDYTRTEALAGGFLSSPEASGKLFLFTEAPDWRSGFSQCEYLLLNDKPPGANLAWVYRAMAQCALSAARETKTEVLGSMQRFMRDELLPDMDPFVSFYFYAWYSMLRNFRNPGDTGTAQTDIHTVVSMALKRILRRADRIDDRETKQVFLSQSRWTSTLYLAAREHKLI
jgi:tetratricopeptide (TPR) repeat protein